MKPSDFFIGVTDFFSVLLPGALITYFLAAPLYGQLFNGTVFPVLATDLEKGVAFLFAAYLIGNIIFGLSSLLDKLVYNRWLRKLFTRNFDLSYKTATAIREQFIPAEEWIQNLRMAKVIDDKQFAALITDNRREIVNTFKWAQYLLGFLQPQSLTEIRKTEADSKFFRSLVLALCFIGAYLLITGKPILGTGAFVLAAVSLYRYGDLRYKSTERAYELIVAMAHRKRNKATPTAVNGRSLDNRSLFSVPESPGRYKDQVFHLVDTTNASTELMDIPASKTWNTGILQENEMIYCISGRSIISENNSMKILFSPGALVRLVNKSTYNIENNQKESLVLVSIKSSLHS